MTELVLWNDTKNPLNEFKPYVVSAKQHPLAEGGLSIFQDAIQVILKFPNGYGASVIKGHELHFRKEHDWEVLPIEWMGENWVGVNDPYRFLDDMGLYIILNTIKIKGVEAFADSKTD